MNDGLPRFTHKQIISVLWGILLCIFLAAIDQTVVIPAVPAMAAELNGFDHLSWIVSAYLLTATAATPIYGKLSDIYGRRALLLPALVLFIVASCLCAVAQTLGQLIAARALQGLGGAGLMAMAQAAIADVVAPRERGRYQGYMASAWGIASVAGPILGGWVTDALSWRWIFWMNLPIGLLAILLCYRALALLPVVSRAARIDWLGAGLLTGAITCFLLVLSWGGVSAPWISPQIGGLLVGGVALVLMLAMLEKRLDDPLLPPRLFANPVFLRGVTVAMLGSLCLFGGTFLLPLYFQLVAGADAQHSGLLVVPFLGSNCVGAYLAGQAARRLGRTKGILLVGLGATICGFLLLATMTPDTPRALGVVYMLLVGVGIGLIMPSSLVIVQNAAERRDVGVATGSLLFLRSMGGAFGTTVVGALLAVRFASAVAKLGIPGQIDLSEVRGHAEVIGGLDAAARQALQVALTSGFHLGFLVCAGFAALAMLVAFGMRDLPLRSSAEPTQLAH
jgi:EmrB/QacA subfamily drug resistance transporter